MTGRYAFVIDHGAGEWTDPWGRVHKTDVLAETVHLVRTGETHTYSNGYGQVTEDVWLSEGGERFYLRNPTDFGGQSTFVSLEQKGRFAQSRLPRPLVSEHGRPVTDEVQAAAIAAEKAA